MNKELFSSNELSELEALEVRGGDTASIMSQTECENNALNCGADVDQTKCVNNEKFCGSSVISQDCKGNGASPCG